MLTQKTGMVICIYVCKFKYVFKYLSIKYLSMRVQMCVCAHARMCVGVYACMYVFVNVCLYERMCLSSYVRHVFRRFI